MVFTPPLGSPVPGGTETFLIVKEGSTSHLGLLPLREEEGNRPTRCSEPLRSKVGGPSKVFVMVVRDGTAWG